MEHIRVESKGQEGSSLNHFQLSVKQDLSYRCNTGSNMETTFGKGKLLTRFHPKLLEKANCSRVREKVQK